MDFCASIYRVPEYTTIEGPVTDLQRKKMHKPGIVHVTARTRGVSYNSIRIVLSDPVDYSFAVHCHDTGDNLRCEGILKKKNGRYVLEEPRILGRTGNQQPMFPSLPEPVA